MDREREKKAIPLVFHDESSSDYNEEKNLKASLGTGTRDAFVEVSGVRDEISNGLGGESKGKKDNANGLILPERQLTR